MYFYEVLLLIWSKVTVEIRLGCRWLIILKRTSYRLRVLTTKSSLGATVVHWLPLSPFYDPRFAILRPIFRFLNLGSFFG